MQEVYLPKLNILWDNYYSYPIDQIKTMWVRARESMDLPDPGKRTVAWHYLMVMTEILKMRREWDHELRLPIGKEKEICAMKKLELS